MALVVCGKSYGLKPAQSGASCATQIPQETKRISVQFPPWTQNAVPGLRLLEAKGGSERSQPRESQVGKDPLAREVTGNSSFHLGNPLLCNWHFVKNGPRIAISLEIFLVIAHKV